MRFLESLEELFECEFEGLGDGAEGVDARGDNSVLDLAEMCSPDSRNVGQLGLRKTAFSPEVAEATTEPHGKRDCHLPMVDCIVRSYVRFTEQ